MVVAGRELGLATRSSSAAASAVCRRCALREDVRILVAEVAALPSGTIVTAEPNAVPSAGCTAMCR